jgi:hypothetical protein
MFFGEKKFTFSKAMTPEVDDRIATRSLQTSHPILVTWNWVQLHHSQKNILIYCIPVLVKFEADKTTQI